MKNKLHPKTFYIYSFDCLPGRYWVWILDKLSARWRAGRPSIMVAMYFDWKAVSIYDKPSELATNKKVS